MTHFVSAVDLLHQIIEGLVDIFTCFGADCEELAVVLCFEIVDSFLIFLQFVVEVGRGQQVALVAEKDFRYFVAAVVDQLLEPVLGIVEGVLVGEVKHDYPRF